MDAGTDQKSAQQHAALRPQVTPEHYEFGRYLGKRRWNSLWHQLDELSRCGARTAIEVGVGAGVLKSLAGRLGVTLTTTDIDPACDPDIICSVTELPFADGQFDAACAFQVLEHLPYEDSLRAFRELVRVAKRTVIISLPDSRTMWRYSLRLPHLGQRNFLIPKPLWRAREHSFDGEHYWELNKRGYAHTKVLADLTSVATLEREYRVFENPFHRFLVFKT